ncbi:MAG: NADPH-dependent F420 reductase, partial [Actinomycetota bacterium]
GVQDLAAEAGASVAPVADAAARSEVVVLALPHAAVAQAVPAMGDLTGKVLVDATNAVGSGWTPDVGDSPSAVAQVKAMAPGAHVIKAFNTLGNDVLETIDPAESGKRPDAFVAGDEQAKAAVGELASQLGMNMIYLGPLEAAPLIEAVAMLWIMLAYKVGLGRSFVIETRQL